MSHKFFITLSFFVLLNDGYCQQLVMRGDHPDPSAVKIGNHYYASSTTSNWAPAFPIMESKDMVHWKQIANVFNELPSWADYYFWAPEISYDNGKVYIYYAAHKKGGNLCIGIASADKPQGPYHDHGPVMCQPDGSIDAFPMRDEKGRLFLIWKEDANSIGKPTPIWAIQLNEERTATIGEKKQLFQNDKVWEHNLVEGVSMIRHGDYFYAFFAAAGCCGQGCTYQTGVARSKNLLGPWEKYSFNPVLSNEGDWICPGHGTPVEKNGRYYFIYHAYNKQSNVYTGRQALIKEFRFTPGGWIQFVNNQNVRTDVPKKNLKTTFNEHQLANDWEWPVFQKPSWHLKGGEFYLSAIPSAAAIVAQKTISADYMVSTMINTQKSTASAGIALIGDEQNLVSIMMENSRIGVHEFRNGKDSVLFERAIKSTDRISFRIEVKNGKDAIFYFAPRHHAWEQLNAQPVNGAYLPPWDRAVRVGLLATGSGTAVFENFKIVNE
jgi:xylan 1,4-beta-xylosidase